MPILIFFVAHWYLSLFSQTFFNHRYASHSAFTMSKSWERFFFLFAYFTLGSSYMSPRAYAILHRMHHAYTDTEKDPHSPKYDASISDMMWRTNKTYQALYKRTYPVEARFLKNLPDWPALDKIAVSWFSTIGWAAAYTTFYIFFATSPWLFLLIPVHILMGPIHGVIINWFAHKYGHTNYDMPNTSKNLFAVDLLMMGEAYHNNHHKNPSSINFGKRWYEVDPTYPIILLLKKLRVIQIRKKPAIQIAQNTFIVKKESRQVEEHIV